MPEWLERIRQFVRGSILALPVILGYAPVGFAYGVLAAQAGLSVVAAGAMSYFVYAGSAQFIAVGLLMADASMLTIIFTTFVVNLRHMLMSAALSPYVRQWTKPLQSWFGFEITDETFAVNLAYFSSGKPVHASTACGLNFFAHMAWVLSSILGAWLGAEDLDVGKYGLDFALPGMFLALIMPWLRKRRGLLAAVCGGATAFMLAGPLGDSRLHLIVGALVGTTIAACVPLQEQTEA